MKYSLRSLMIAVTLVCVGTFCTRHALVIHDERLREAAEHEAAAADFLSLSSGTAICMNQEEMNWARACSEWNATMAKRFTRAAWRPWAQVDEIPPPKLKR